ncbi:MAG: hypothetical protein EB023_11590 [Flavobacteriia bacterium]|nr:hypothetical protein [Flavobacteriia bacterium]
MNPIDLLALVFSFSSHADFMKAFGILRDNESNVRSRLCVRSRAKAIAAGKKPGAKKAIGPEQEKRIHELLEKDLSFKEISELIGVDIKTFYWWRKKNNM